MRIYESKTQKTEQNIPNKLGGQSIQSPQNAQKMQYIQTKPNTKDIQNPQYSKILEKDIDGNISVPVNIIIKATKSVCKITIKGNEGKIYGTGFFMKVSNTKKYLVTNYHVISEKNINDDIEIEIYNEKTMKLNLNNRKIEYFPRPKDITIIEIKNTDEIYNDILFLDYDRNYVEGYKNIYQNVPIFLIQHPNGQSAEHASGTIVNVYDFEFDYDISTKNGSSGSPIMLYTKDINSIQVIGIHKEAYVIKI